MASSDFDRLRDEIQTLEEAEFLRGLGFDVVFRKTARG
jgi:hypothetical protein